MSEQMSIESILEGETPVETTAETPAETPVETEVETEVVEVEVEEPTGETATPPVAEETPAVPIAALHDERDKRKAAQRERDELQKQLEENKPDFWEDPQKAIDSVTESLRAEFNQELRVTRLNMSVAGAQSRHEDYDVMEKAFADAAKDNPALIDQMWADPDPAEYAYKTGKQFTQLNQFGGDLDSMRAQMRAEVRKELEAELKGKSDTLASVPESLTSETSASAPREKVSEGPTPLENILPSV